MGIIIAGYAGIGKSSFCQMTENSIDLPSMPYKWVLPPNDNTKTDFEDMKAAPYLVFNSNFPYNYIKEILIAMEQYDYVVIPAIERVLTMLEHELHLPYVLVYPSIELKNEYKDRYIRRGNNETFLEVFVDEYEQRIRNLQEDTFGIHIELSTGEYLIDVKDKIKAAANTIKQKNVMIDKYTRERFNRLECDFCICIPDYTGTNYIFSIDINNDENRKFVYDLGKIAYEKQVLLVTNIPYDVYLNNDFERVYTEELKSKEEVLKKINELGD